MKSMAKRKSCLIDRASISFSLFLSLSLSLFLSLSFSLSISHTHTHTHQKQRLVLSLSYARARYSVGLNKGRVHKKTPPHPRTPPGPYAYACCRILGGCVFVQVRHPCFLVSEVPLIRAHLRGAFLGAREMETQRGACASHGRHLLTRSERDTGVPRP